MADRKVEGQWINGKWVMTGIGAARGSDSTEATTRAKFREDAPSAGAAATANKNKPKLPYRRDYPAGPEGDAEYQKAYDAYMGKGRKPKETSDFVMPPQEPMGYGPPAMMPGMMQPGMGPSMAMGSMDPGELARQMAAEELRRRYGAMLTLGPLYDGGMG